MHSKNRVIQLGIIWIFFVGICLAESDQQLTNRDRISPFNPSTTIQFALPEPGRVRLALYDLRGRQIRTLLQGEWTPGLHSIVWDGCDDFGRLLPSGVYFYRIEIQPLDQERDLYVNVKKMLLIK